jgi:Ca2+-binding RTX toxin-like protein
MDGSAGSDLIEIEASTPTYVSTFIDGEAGGDTLIGGPGPDNLLGAPAVSEHPSDSLFGRGGDDSLANAAVLNGGPGSDLLIAAPCGSQALSGGSGVDSASFARSTGHVGVEATLGGVAVDAPGSAGISGGVGGCPSPTEEPTEIGETVERIEGSRWDDVLSGDAGANTLLGRGGNDRLAGQGGEDILVGGTGRDQLLGGPGFDRLFAADGGRDRLLDCGEPSEGVALVDPVDPPARHCARVKSG